MKSVIILCGGGSTRMGKDKGSLIFKGKPMIQHVYDAVKDTADEIIIVLRDSEQINKYKKMLNGNITFITDKSMDQGPLVGILSGLSSIESDEAQILPCDSPYISNEFILKMFDRMEGSDFDALVPIWDDGHREPLHSIYKKDVMVKIQELMKDGKSDVNTLINSLNTEFINVDELDPTQKSYQNMNTIKDLEK